VRGAGNSVVELAVVEGSFTLRAVVWVRCVAFSSGEFFDFRHNSLALAFHAEFAVCEKHRL
jgi:hypothetical protein